MCTRLCIRNGRLPTCARSCADGHGRAPTSAVRAALQVIDGEAGTLQNIVRLGSWARIEASARCEASSDVRTGVDIQGAGIYLGPLRIPVPTGAGAGWVDWLYLDEDIRVTRGSKGSLFVHRREAA